ncbi:hypothetical protein BDF19DRAFT_414560 [Syncephalis fuscata]|nr:hypothetical protein BDF19DRAFT_414560 [Syncephalis fuscata]
MDDMFIVMVSTYPKLHNTRLEVWRRKTYKLNFAHTLPYGCRLESVSGKWALLLCMEYNADSVFNGQMIIWDLELNRQHIKAIDDPWDGVCIFRATETAVTVYAARLDSDNPELITWTFYEFSSDAEPKQLLQNCFTTEFEFYDYIEPSPLDASRILLQEVDIRNNRKLLIHNVMPDNPSRLELDMVEIPEEHVTAALLSQGSCSKIGDRLLVEKQDRFTYNKAIYWPNALECRHIIGSLCIIYEKQDDDSIRIALADNNLGTRLRYLDSYSSDHLNAFLMTSAVIIDNDKCEVNIIDYGAL